MCIPVLVSGTDRRRETDNSIIEEVVCNYLLEEQIFRAIDEERKFWIDRLEAQGASLETIRKIDPDYEPETEYTGDGGCYTVIEDDKMIYER